MSSVRSQVQAHNFSQDVQLQVIVNKNEGEHRIQDNTSMQKTTKTTQNMSSDFCIEPQIINEDISTRPNPTKKSSEKSKYLECPYAIDSVSNIILSKHLTYFWKYLKWPLSLCFVCIFIGIVTYACVRALKNKSFVRNCFNSNATFGCSLATISNSTVPHSDSKFYDNENLESSKLFKVSSFSNKTVIYEDVTEAAFDGSQTILRPVMLPHSLQADSTERNNIVDNSKNDYGKFKKQVANYEERSNDQKTFKKSNSSKSETRNILGFTSGHQNFLRIPTGDDEETLRLINEELMKIEQQTEPSKVVSRTEGAFAVSPTVPLIYHDLVETSIVNSPQSDDTQCQSTSLAMCRGILQYDLTSTKSKNFELNALDLKSFEHLIASNCSVRAAEFVCSLLEPECRPKQLGFLQPCKRFCKSILEACSNLVFNSDVLTYIFDCDKYPDSDDKNVCEDPTRRKICFENEFKCQDMTCIPKQWQCDNIKDCSMGEDEFGCLVCSPEEFRCKSNEKCLPNEHRCDTNKDCADGSDEFDCDSETDEFDAQPYPRIFSSFTSFLLPNHTIDRLFTPVADDRLAYASELNESQVAAAVRADDAPVSTNLGSFQDTKEIMMTSDSEKKFKISQSNNSTQKTDLNRVCAEHELRCVSGMCITVDQLCDKIIDCAGGEDELSCAYEEGSGNKDPQGSVSLT